VGSNETARGLWRSELRLCPQATLEAAGGAGGGLSPRVATRRASVRVRAPLFWAALVRLLAAACSVELHGRFRLQDRVRVSVALILTISII